MSFPSFAAPTDELATPSHFMNLPVELRLLIYEELLRASNKYAVITIDRRTIAIGFHLYPVILRICKAIYNEALPVLYGQNTFLTYTFPRIYVTRWSGEYLRRSNAALIRRVIVMVRPFDVFDREVIKLSYSVMGIQWDKLSLWAVIMGNREYASQMNEDWLVTMRDPTELKKLGIDLTWALGADWLVRKDCVRHRSR